MKTSRRNFIKTTGILGLSAPLMGANMSLLEKSKKVVTATHWGTSLVTIRNGVITDSKPLDVDAQPSIMEKALKSRTYNQTRVEYPYIREGFLKNRHKSDTTKRGKERFVRVSWEEANQIVYEELSRVQKSYGKDSIYAGSYGWFGVGKLNNPQTLLKRMLNTCGVNFVDSKGTYSTGAVNVIAPYVIGTNHHHRHTSLDLVAKHTDNIILIGNDMVNTNAIDWNAPAHKAYLKYEKIKEASKKRKMNIISIDPQITDTSKYFNAQNIQIIPNTDVALFIGIANYLYKNNLHDKTFLKRYTVGFDQFSEYIVGKKDNIDKTPKWASKITGIKEDEIINLAKTMVNGRTMLMIGWALQRGDHGEQTHWIVYTLAAMLGQLGKDGGGFGSSYQYSNNGATLYNSPGVPGITAGKAKSLGTGSYNTSFSTKAIPVAKVSDMLLNPGKKIEFNGEEVEFADIKLVYWAGGNPMHHQQDRNKMVKAWQKPEVIINQDPYWTASSRMADIILPATTEIERDDIVAIGSKSGAGIVAIKKGIEPIEESKSDYDIFRDICKKFGREKEFTEGRDQLGWVKHFYESSIRQAKARNIKLPSFEEFWEKGYVEFKEKTSQADTFNYMEDFIEDPLENPLGTPSGRIEIFSRKIASYKYDDCLGHPAWYEPAEYLGNSTKDYPYHLVSPHPKFRLHSQLNNTILRNVYEIKGREPIYIHPKDAKKKGIKDGDIVLVSSKRGKILAGAIITKDIREKTVLVFEGAWYDPKYIEGLGTICVHGDVNVLTLDKGTSRLAQGNIAHTTLVTFEKYTGKIPPVTVFSKPEII
ncbi:molybdopterin-dependent oxidoreductase [Malaciobacter marinus]|uniref:molybdopterin-dependent oxidoreductase n=1 Tax=Malaciobacter marinus TaxID=505249 RepID=UPI003AFF888B